MSAPLLTVEIQREQDVVLTRQRARQIAAAIGFDEQEQTRLATAVSEVARNAFRYAGGGRAEFLLDASPTPSLIVRVRDQGPGIPHLDDVMDGRYRSDTGMGLGLIGSKRLMDGLNVETHPGQGTVVTLVKHLPKHAGPLTSRIQTAIADYLASRPPSSGYDELHQQNQTLIRTMEQLQQRQEEVERLNRELEETNRGVLALYAELDDKAEQLRRASELKTRFLSNMTHELRTPLNSIIMVSSLLLDGVEGTLTNQQQRPVRLIHGAATSLLEMVNDLLDLAKIEAGKTDVKVSEFSVLDLLAALRGMFRPLMPPDGDVELIFETPVAVPTLRTDEGKVSQILRNYISNALKFTERGEVRVSASMDADGNILFAVRDTGVGIAPEDQHRLFQEFSQLGSRPSRQIKGTGLGLSLSKRLAELLGGRVYVESTPGAGSTFAAVIPPEYAGNESPQAAEEVRHV